MTETELRKRVLLDVGREVRLFPNPRGNGWMGRVVSETADRVTLAYPRRVSFGLAPGASDLLGWKPVTITPDMVGATLAVFAAVELKQAGGTHPVTEEQRRFLDAVERAGGVAGVARSPEQGRLVLGLPQRNR